MRTAAAIVLGLVLAGAAPARAQEADNQALARRFVEISLTGMDKVVEAAIRREMSEMPDDMQAEHRDWFGANAQPILMRHMRPLIDEMAVEYARRFSAEELQALVAFYDTPLGRGVAFKQMEIGAEAGGRMGQFQMAYLVELMTKFCAEFDCEARDPPAAPTRKPARR